MILYSQWLSLPITTRQKIAHEFGIKKTGPTHVNNNMVQSDGYELKDIESKLIVNNLQTYLLSDESDISKLWTMMVDKIEGRVVEMPVIKEEHVVPLEEVLPVIKPHGKKRSTKI